VVRRCRDFWHVGALCEVNITEYVYHFWKSIIIGINFKYSDRIDAGHRTGITGLLRAILSLDHDLLDVASRPRASTKKMLWHFD
jgi:hypothetical protein